ncbi:MAG: response regulator transcription factor [Rubricoccaceae bacterium]
MEPVCNSTFEPPKIAYDFKPDTSSILVASGRPLSRRGLAQTLDATTDLRVTAQAASERAALRALRTRGPFHVAVVDLRTPGSLLLSLRAEAPDVPIVVVSAQPETTAGVEALRLGAVAVVDRNGPPECIVDAVRTALAGRRYVSAALGDALAKSYQTGDAPSSSRLSPRQRQVITLIASGLERKEIAERLSIEVGSVTAFRRRAARKLGLRTDADLTRYAIREGLIGLYD